MNPQILIVLAAIFLGACAPAQTKLVGPGPEIMKDCPDLPLPPKNDGNPGVRGKYYGRIFGEYELCRDRYNGLRKWADRAAKT
jgi:hypothetical protein